MRFPFWESNGDAIVLYSIDENEYLEYYYEDGPRFEVIARGYQQFISWVLLKLGDWYDEDIEPVATVLGYQHWAELQTYWKSVSNPEMKGLSFSELQDRFLSLIPVVGLPGFDCLKTIP